MSLNTRDMEHWNLDYTPVMLENFLDGLEQRIINLEEKLERLND